MNKPRELDYDKCPLPFSVVLTILVLSAIFFLFLAISHNAPRRRHAATQNTTATSQTK